MPRDPFGPDPRELRLGVELPVRDSNRIVTMASILWAVTASREELLERSRHEIVLLDDDGITLDILRALVATRPEEPRR